MSNRAGAEDPGRTRREEVGDVGQGQLVAVAVAETLEDGGDDGGVPGRAVQVDQVLQVHGALVQAPRLFADGGGRLPELSGSASVERVLRRDEQLRGLRHRSHLVMEEHEERGLGQGRG